MNAQDRNHDVGALDEDEHVIGKQGEVEQIENVCLSATSTGREGYRAATPEEVQLDRRINLKTDCIVIFVLAAGFLFQAIDKGNIGNAATTESFIKDVHLKPNDVSNSVSLYAATFIPCMPVSVALGRIIGPRWWLPFIMVAWGAVTTAQAAMTSRAQMMALRLLLGVCEAGYVPTAYYFIGTLYPTYQAGFRMGLMSMSFTFAGAFSGLIAYGCFILPSSRWKDWQVLFLVQGSVTLFISVLALVSLPTNLGTAWFLTKRERAHAARRMVADTAAVSSGADASPQSNSHSITLRNVVEAFKDWKKFLIVIFNMCATTPSYGFAIFLPLVVKGMGYDSVKANLMAVPPFMVGAVGLTTIVWLSDYFRERSGFAALSMFISIIGYIVLITSSNNQLRYGFLHIAMIGAGTANPLIAAWLTDNTPDQATRAVIMGFYGLTNIAGVIAGQIFRSSYAPTYHVSLVATMVIVLVGMFGFLGVRGLYMLENRNRRREIATWSDEQFQAERMDARKQGHAKRYFIFGY
ncbi:hypothetical protein N7474_008500 [Penicillium riverlandense]|uniref:uncharacterized protein n=1 Tax=Penicillium riverlandense TaxID=1903569 RepID=UPI002549059A|nr:uncharacterized protein N7474_008500 [Penicillium riverlandense]KAJ5812199.1 hypothetical protein N7474_008500 [Penicillium riverlandense]